MKISSETRGQKVGNLIDANCYMIRKDRILNHYIILNYSWRLDGEAEEHIRCPGNPIRLVPGDSRQNVDKLWIDWR